jgi:hypothetical protein
VEEKKPCPYCNDSGQIKFEDPEKKSFAWNKQGKPLVEYCYYTCPCINNKVVNKSFNKLSGIPDITLEETIAAGRFAGFRNLILYGNERKFLHLVKATMVLHANYHHTFEFLNGIELVQKYYVEQPQGVYRCLQDLEDKDMVIFMFDSAPDNKAQNTTVFEVIKSRNRMNDPAQIVKKERVLRPTWIYTQSQEGITKSKEYSQDVANLFSTDFSWLSLEGYKTPFNAPSSDTMKKRSKTQDSLGDI